MWLWVLRTRLGALREAAAVDQVSVDGGETARDSGTVRGVGFESIGHGIQGLGLVTGVQGQQEGIPGMGDWMGPRKRNSGNPEVVSGCQAPVTGCQLRWLRQLFGRALCASFCSGESQAGRKRTRGQASALPVAWPRSRWVCSSVSLPADTLACQHTGPPCTRGEVPSGAPLHSCCLCGNQPVPLLCVGGTPHPHTPGCSAWNKTSLALA